MLELATGRKNSGSDISSGHLVFLRTTKGVFAISPWVKKRGYEGTARGWKRETRQRSSCIEIISKAMARCSKIKTIVQRLASHSCIVRRHRELSTRKICLSQTVKTCTSSSRGPKEVNEWLTRSCWYVDCEMLGESTSSALRAMMQKLPFSNIQHNLSRNRQTRSEGASNQSQEWQHRIQHRQLFSDAHWSH